MSLINKYLFLFLLIAGSLSAQSGQVKGLLVDESGASIPFANVVLFTQADSTLYKVDISDENGVFTMPGISDGTYYLEASFVGYTTMYVPDVVISDEQRQVDLETLTFTQDAVQLETATVTARRAMVEVKADRTVFNVEGTINAAGSDGIDLLRKAPGVLIDNNENITVLGRSGVLLYVDGKRLPLSGEDLTAYLRNLNASQIDRIDIITSPGAKYEAQGNAGIIDIRLKRIKEVGRNTIVNLGYSQGLHHQANASINTNYRNGDWNVFASANAADNTRVNEIAFVNQQNGFNLAEDNNFRNEGQNIGFRAGADYNLNSNSTVGFIVSGGANERQSFNTSMIQIAPLSSPQVVDSTLIADNRGLADRTNQAYNLNYAYRLKEKTFNVDVDYASFGNDSQLNQPNTYVDENGDVLSSIDYFLDTPVEIDIFTTTVDYEQPFAGGKLGLGAKFSEVVTENTFLFNTVIGGENVLSDTRSNSFDYDEKVYAGYVSYNRPLTEKIKFAGGLRLETTDATGDLRAFRPDLVEPPVELNYTNLFPSVGFTYTSKPTSVWSLNYGRRINRPDYNVLNPFRNQVSELTFQRGNARLNPEIVNNVELGYLWKYRYNFKVSYTLTTDQITRLIGPDDIDDRASFISWDNLATQEIISFNASAPIQFMPWWSGYFNFSMSYLDNQADYGGGQVVDVQALTYNIYQQQTFTLGKGWTGEISGWFSGPGVWGGVFEYDSSYSLNFGLQRKFFNDRLNAKLSAQDVTFQSFWSGTTAFNGQVGTGRGNWDSRRVGLNLTYSFGDGKTKARKRKTGIESESSRVGS